MAAAEDQEARRRRLVAQAKTDASILKLEQQRRRATDEERSAAYAQAGRPKAATVDEAAAQIREQEAAPTRDPSVSDGIRDRGARELQAGLQLYTEADRKRSVRVRNKDYEGNLAYTETMGPAGQAVGRRGLFSPGSVALAPAPAQPPVQVVVQAPGAPAPAPPMAQPAPAPVDPLQAAPGAAAAPPVARAVPGGAAVGRVPGQLPTAPLGAVPLEGEPPPDETPEQELARLEAEAATLDPAALEAQAMADYGPMDGAGEPTGPGVPEGAMPRGGLLQQQLDAQEMQANAVVSEQTQAALALRDAADQARSSLDEAAAAKAEANARLEQELEASQAANRVVADLTTKARERGAIDPKRAWANAGIGTKMGFALQIALTSFGGKSDPLAAVRRYIDEDVEAQREESAKIGSDIDAARAVADDRANLLQQARSVVGDEQAAQDVVRVARLEQVKADLEARMAAAGIQRVGSEQEVLLNSLEQEIAAKSKGIAEMAVRNPQYFTKSVSVYGKGTREGMKLAGKNLIESGAGAGEMADEQAGKLEIEGEKGRLDQVLQQQKAAAKSGDKVAEQAWKFAEKTERLQSMNMRIDQLLALDDIPGYGYTEGVDSSGKLDTDQLLELIIEDYGRIQSQGAIGAEERVAFREQVYKGVKFSDGRLLEGSEERLRKNLEGLKQGATFRMEGLQRALPEATSSYYDRVAAPAQFDARFAGSTSADVVEEE